MNTLIEEYEKAKNNSKEFMQKGQLSEYLKALLAMKKYKRLLFSVIAN